MTKANYIAEWDSRYEVSDKGTEFRPGDKKRANLKYVRLAVHGKSEGIGWKKLRRAVGNENAFTAFGLFCKLLELAADQEREYRGFLLDEKRLPATSEYIELVWGVPKEVIEKYLPKLTEIGWIEEREFGQIQNKSGESGVIPEDSEITPLTKPNPTEQNLTQPNIDGEKKKVDLSDSASVKTKSTFGLKINDIIKFETNSGDHTALVNLSDKLDRIRSSNPKIFDEVIAIAQDVMRSTSVNNPMAVFFAKVNKQYGLKPGGTV